MEETQWIDWYPKVGDIKPDLYRVKDKKASHWDIGEEPRLRVTHGDFTYCDYQIPAPVVTPPEDRPPWIDPQCKFRWGDRVKDRQGNVWFVNHPDDGLTFPVICTKERGYLYPYIEWDSRFVGDFAVEVFDEEYLELFPEELPQHFDDRLLDADQPQEQIQTARVPREIWVNEYGGNQMYSYTTKHQADVCADASRIACTHFREVFPDDLSNIQYSPGG